MTTDALTALAVLLAGPLILYKPLVYVHEWAHAIALERYGVQPSIHINPIYSRDEGFARVGGYVTAPTRHLFRLSWREHVSICLAPLAVPLLTFPVPFVVWAAFGHEAASPWPLVALWVLATGPSIDDYLRLVQWPSDWNALERDTDRTIREHAAFEGALGR